MLLGELPQLEFGQVACNDIHVCQAARDPAPALLALAGFLGSCLGGPLSHLSDLTWGRLETLLCGNTSAYLCSFHPPRTPPPLPPHTPGNCSVAQAGLELSIRLP